MFVSLTSGPFLFSGGKGRGIPVYRRDIRFLHRNHDHRAPGETQRGGDDCPGPETTGPQDHCRLPAGRPATGHEDGCGDRPTEDRAHDVRSRAQEGDPSPRAPRPDP